MPKSMLVMYIDSATFPHSHYLALSMVQHCHEEGIFIEGTKSYSSEYIVGEFVSKVLENAIVLALFQVVVCGDYLNHLECRNYREASQKITDRYERTG